MIKILKTKNNKTLTYTKKKKVDFLLAGALVLTLISYSTAHMDSVILLLL